MRAQEAQRAPEKEKGMKSVIAGGIISMPQY
jgi:hypothetical protein